MENSGVLKSVLYWLFPNGRLTLKAALLWLLIVALFTGYGFIDSAHQIPRTPFSISGAAEGATLLGGLGIGLATCMTGGLLILANFQANRFGRFTAIVHLLTSSFIGAISTPVAILLVRPLFRASWGILGGEKVMGVVLVSGWMGIAAIALFVLFTITVLLSRQKLPSVLRDSRSVDTQHHC